MGGKGEGVNINIRLARIGLEISVDWEHDTRIDHVMPAHITYPVTQFGHTTVFATEKNNEYHQSTTVCVNNYAKGSSLIFLLCRLNDEIKTVHLFFNCVES
jgi:hypothetical protein